MDYPKIFARVIEICQRAYEEEKISHPIKWDIRFIFEKEEYSIPLCFYIGEESNAVLKSHLSLIPKYLESSNLNAIVIRCSQMEFYAKLSRKNLLEISGEASISKQHFIKEEYIGMAAVGVSWLLGFILGKMTC